jgi:hypothetical protein
MAQIILDSNNNLIQGDFDNATLNNRTKLQTTTTNATTNVYVVPNGSSTSAGVSVANNSSLTNASKIVMATNGSTDTQIISGVNGSGSYLPMSFYTNNTLGMQLSTAGVLTVTGGVAGSSLPAGSVIQVVSTNKTNVFSTTSTSAVDITGMTVNITPSSASNKILVQVTMSYGSDVSPYAKVTLLRNGSIINIGDASGSCSRVSIPMNVGIETASQLFTSSMTYLDSPATTSALTYKLQVFVFSSRGFYLNRSAQTSDANHLAATSSITVMEIKG